MTRRDGSWMMNRRQMLQAMAAVAGSTLLPGLESFATDNWKATEEDEAFLDDLERQADR